MKGAAGVLFGTVCAGGAAAALVLLVHDVRTTESVQARVVSTSRQGLTTAVVVEVRNTTASPRCAVVRAVAQDREGRDLGTSGRTRLEVAARARPTLTTSLRLTARDYAERLATVRAVLSECEEERPAQK
jgi:hypothetical protein